MEQPRSTNAGEHPLTLKTLYRMLTRTDYPVHSYAVFSEKGLHGQTLARFWYTLFQQGLPAEIDLSVFDASDHRSRSLTKLLNSSGSAGFLGKWYDELSSRLNQDFLIRLVHAWMDRLEAWQYSSEALGLRLNAYLECLSVEEPLKRFFTRLADSLAVNTDTLLLFRHGLLLSWLTLFALYGTRMQDARLNRLRTEMENKPLSELYRAYLYNRLSRQPQVISERQCALCVQPLPPEAFFGREKNLAQAMEIMHSGGKLIIQGIGGIGKTEFVRQLLALLTRSGIWTRLAYVQYEGNLSVSLAQAFPSLQEVSPGDRVSGARRLLEQRSAGKTLLLIDNLSETSGQDPDLEDLASWGCDMIITTRLMPLDGFIPLVLSGLPKEEGEQLFFRYDGHAQTQREDVETLCSFFQGHPLAITLFANLCGKRYWPVSRLLKQLEDQGLSNLSYVQRAASLKLVDVFESTFSTAFLTGTQVALMRLFSVLPYRYWLPDALWDYARDIHEDCDDLTDSCQVLCDLGWLLSGPEGYAVHPLIAETIMLQCISPDDFPRLCAKLQEDAGEENALSHRVLVSCALRMSGLNLPLVRALARTEQLLGRNSDFYLPEKVYSLQRSYLDAHSHEDADETDYWLALGIRDIVTFSTAENLSVYLKHILGLGRDSVRHLKCLYTLLEYAVYGKDSEVVDQLFEMMRPDDDSDEMVDYLISFSVRQREGSHDPSAAIASLRQAKKMLMNAHEDHSLRQANLLYRWACSELDLSRPEQARPLLERCLRIMKKHSYPDHSANMMSTRNTYAFTLSLVKEYSAALREYRRLAALYRKQQRTHTSGYSAVCSNAALLLDQMGKYAEAKEMILESLRIDEELSPSDAVLATHLRNAGLILSHAGAWTEAVEYSEKALRLRRSAFGEDSPWTADAQAVMALPKASLGHKEEALSLVRSACETLGKNWGSSHRHTQNAQRIREEIESLCTPEA